jgi:diphthamide synthase (EF-2-diphthine--ammonia ligase)
MCEYLGFAIKSATNSISSSCTRLNLVSLAYLWRRDQAELLQEMIDCQLDAIIIKVNLDFSTIFPLET